MSRIIGIDIALWQGAVDFPSLPKAGIQFVIIKATNGSRSVDPRFKQNWAASKGLLPRGAYLWFTDDDPVQQADFAVKTLSDAGDIGDISLTVDFEEPKTAYRGTALLDRLRTCLARIETVTGRAPILYTGSWYWQGYAHDLDAPDIVDKYPLWLAQYPRATLRDRRACGTSPPELPEPNCPKPWKDRRLKPFLWQFDGDGGCQLPNGVDADFNEFLGGDFDAFCGRTQGPPPTGISSEELQMSLPEELICRADGSNA